MSAAKIRHQNVAEKKKAEEKMFEDIQCDVTDTEGVDDVLREDANIFLMNNLMMSVQFFENYERDIKLLRENWFKEFSLDSHHKKCFYADSLFRFSGSNVRFSPRHGVNKNSDSPLHPFRIYITSDNVEAAFDPSALGRNTLKVRPEYQFRVATDEKAEKMGCISLIEFKIVEETHNAHGKTERHTYSFDSDEATDRNSIYIQKSNFDDKSSRRFTKTETSVGFLRRDSNLKALGKRFSFKYFPAEDGTIPANAFYKFEESRLKPKTIHDFRMNSASDNSHEIPPLCFQYREVRNMLNRRMADLSECFRTQRLLNTAAFKGHFCDLLLEKLYEPLNLDADAVDDGTVQEEFVIVHQKGVPHCITPVITIIDWNDFVALKRFQNNENDEEHLWPTKDMQRIMKILPCYAVPTCHYCSSTENLDYEKTWKLVFPKTEEFLLLHMMHAHVRCYFFVLLFYKSFLEPEINGASLGPKHLAHLLFWKVHKNFLAWPEDRPGETFLNYLKALYKKLQNKYLPDFFITSRNLFVGSLQRDLHKAQSLLKKIIENPVPYMIRAISQLTLRPDFYPAFDYLQLNATLTAQPVPVMLRRKVKKEKKKKVRFQVDEEQLWTKNVIKQLELEKKAEKQEEASRLSVNSINFNEILNVDTDDWEKCTQILKIFTSHFLQMGNKSVQYNSLHQSLMYLYQAQKLLQLMAARGVGQETLKETRERIDQLKQNCCSKIKRELIRSPGKAKKVEPASDELEEHTEKEEDVKPRPQEPQESVKSNDEDAIVSIKL